LAPKSGGGAPKLALAKRTVRNSNSVAGMVWRHRGELGCTCGRATISSMSSRGVEVHSRRWGAASTP
jgi:hypothetical protein